jgi:hypothetical protein
MESVGRYCYFNFKGECYFVRNDPSKCTLCPNFISYKKEALEYSESDSLPIDYFDLIINKGNGNYFQETLSRF